MTEHRGARPVGVSGYNDGCRCSGCKAGKARLAKRYHCLRVRTPDRRLTVSAAEAQAHLLWLSSNGVGPTVVAILTGLSRSHLNRIRTGSQKRIMIDSEALILEVTRNQALDSAVVDASLTWRRLHGLMALGWPADFLAAELGYDRPNLHTPPIGRRRTSVKNARAVAALCGKFGNRPGPSKASRQLAQRKGWPVYGSWDDDLEELADGGAGP